MQTRIVNIDWLEVYCLADEYYGLKDAEFYEHEGWTVLRRDYGTRVYKQMFTLCTRDGKSFIEIRRDPSSLKGEHGGVMPPDSCHIRLTNYACYVGNPVQRLREFLAKYNYIVVSIYRLDICLDFEKFDSGDLPDKFVRRFMEGKYSKMNQANISAFGKDFWERRAWNSLSWGARKSMVGTKMYCKSLELQEAKDKPYIRYVWFKGGLVDDPQTLTKRDENGNIYKPEIWRVEFSINSSAKKWFVIDRCDTKRKAQLYQPHTLSMYDTPQKLLVTFNALAQHYFRFKYYEDGKRKDRCKDKELFHFTYNDKFLTIKTNVSESKTKTFEDRLLMLLEQFDLTTTQPELIKACSVLKNALKRKSLQTFAGCSFTQEEILAMQLLVSTRLGSTENLYKDIDMREAVDIIKATQGEIF